MSPTKPDVKLDSRYSIKETCELLGIHRHTLHNWTMEGKIKCCFRKVNGRPVYLGVDILSCWGGVM